MTVVNVTYEGELHCTCVHEKSGARFVTDAPTDNMGKGEAFSPTDLVGTALATCIMTVMGIVAQRHEIHLRGMHAKVVKEMVTAPRRIGRLTLEFTVPANPSPEGRQRLENAARTCPVHRSLHPDVQVEISFRWGA